MGDEKVKEIIINTVNKETYNNMRHYNEKLIIKEGQIASFSVKELARKVDVEEEESTRTKKIKDIANLVHKMARISVKKVQASASAMK